MRGQTDLKLNSHDRGIVPTDQSGFTGNTDREASTCARRPLAPFASALLLALMSMPSGFAIGQITASDVLMDPVLITSQVSALILVLMLYLSIRHMIITTMRQQQADYEKSTAARAAKKRAKAKPEEPDASNAQTISRNPVDKINADRPQRSGTTNGLNTTNPIVQHDPATAETAVPWASEVTAAAAQEEEAHNLQLAGGMWEMLGRWNDAIRCYEADGQDERVGHLMLALGRYNRALPYLKRALEKDPANEATRLRLVEIYFNTSKPDDAEKLAQALIGPDAPVNASGSFLEAMARNWEALNDEEKALDYYRQALEAGQASTEVELRIQLLKQIQRIKASSTTYEPASSANELLQKYIRESTIVPRPDLNAPPQQDDIHEIIVGHLALGFTQTEPRHSVGSVFSLSRRFQLRRQLAESAYGVTFEATDQLLDFPVALKLIRISKDGEVLEVLKERLRAISQLNHPNLAKITFVDRDGSLIRIATEYLPGGNLREFLAKLGGVGVPLLIRMVMHVSSALHTAHLRGVPHGDIRPENILIGPDQRIKIVDFALSPIPVKRLEYARSSVGEASETPRTSDFVISNEGVQSDLLQLGELLEFMLGHARKAPDPVQAPAISGADALEELRELVERLRNGGFTSVLRLWQVLEQIFERTLPGGGQGDSARSPKTR